MNYIIIEAQTNNSSTAVVTPAVYENDRVEAEAVFLEKCAYARRSNLDTHTVVLLNEDGDVLARKTFNN